MRGLRSLIGESVPVFRVILALAQAQAQAQAPAPRLTVQYTQNIYISLSGWLYQTAQEVSDDIPGTDTTLQMAEGITIINKKEA